MSLSQLEAFNQKLLDLASLEERLFCLDQKLQIENLDVRYERQFANLGSWKREEEWILKQLLLLAQVPEEKSFSLKGAQLLVQSLLPVDAFYRPIGGLIGYQIEVLRRLFSRPCTNFEGASFRSPTFHDISEETKEVKDAIRAGLEALPKTAEFYPLGGAADRLHLVDSITGCDLPAAKMEFAGWSLFEGLIRDVQAREYLYEKVYGKKVIVPIGIMTSAEKDNHRLIVEMCESKNWFGRPKESFRLFCQPLVPAVDEKGNWVWQGAEKFLLKPGGHGALWKVAQDAGVLSWLSSQGIQQILVRQVNNPLAGVDSGLLAFLGFGVQHRMAFGFVSCPRLLKAAEGVNVLVERPGEYFVERVLTNIEYCDFDRFGIEDAPLTPGGIYSRFTGNANILFVRLEDLKKAIEVCPYPGLLINLKPAFCTLEGGEKKTITLGRLESTMQNMADVFVERHPLGSPPKTDRTFVLYNHRKKTISTTKKAYISGGSFQETPEQSFYDVLKAASELLKLHCSFSLPPPRSIEETQKLGPACAFLYHPALGPLYSVIAQKIRGGKLTLGSELQIELAEMDLENVEIEGSFRILAEKPLDARCRIKNVKIFNRGVDWEASLPFWQSAWRRFETAEIILKGRSEWIAEDAIFLGSQKWIVEDGCRMRVFADGSFQIEPFSEKSCKARALHEPSA